MSKLFFEKLKSVFKGRGGGGAAWDANFFVCVLLSNYYSKILLQLCKLLVWSITPGSAVIAAGFLHADRVR